MLNTGRQLLKRVLKAHPLDPLPDGFARRVVSAFEPCFRVAENGAFLPKQDAVQKDVGGLLAGLLGCAASVKPYVSPARDSKGPQEKPLILIGEWLQANGYLTVESEDGDRVHRAWFVLRTAVLRQVFDSLDALRNAGLCGFGAQAELAMRSLGLAFLDAAMSGDEQRIVALAPLIEAMPSTIVIGYTPDDAGKETWRYVRILNRARTDSG